MSESVVAATFAYRHQAEFARETLRAAGIDSVLVADDAGGAYAGLAFTRRARLLVRPTDLQRAIDLLADSGLAGEDATDSDPD